jgi:flagellar protein FlgJ
MDTPVNMPLPGAANAAPALGKNRPSPDQVKQLSKEFESFFIYSVLQNMSATVDTGEGVIDGGYAEEVWRDILNEHMATKITERGGFGLSDTISKHLLSYQEAQ